MRSDSDVLPLIRSVKATGNVQIAVVLLQETVGLSSEQRWRKHVTRHAVATERGHEHARLVDLSWFLLSLQNELLRRRMSLAGENYAQADENEEEEHYEHCNFEVIALSLKCNLHPARK